MRWLLVKDLRILRRSPPLLAVLVIYPVVVALLIGFALSRGPERPRVAVLDQVPPDEALTIGGERFDILGARNRVFSRIDPLRVHSRAEAVEKVKSGEALGALIIPRDTVKKLDSQLERPRIEVLVNEEDPLKARLVDDTVTALIAEANSRISRAYTRVALSYLRLLVNGGDVGVLGLRFNILGLRKTEQIMRAARDRLPRGAPERRQVSRVIRFVRLAQQNLGLTDRALGAVSEPIGVRKQVLSGTKVPLTTFAVAISVAISLMFVTVLLAAAALALEREENVFGRLVRGPVTRTTLLAEKIVLAGACSLVVTLVMLVGLGQFITLEWGRFPLWVVGLLAGALAFAALGSAIGGVAREVPAASLLAFALLLPVAFLALVPSGVVSTTMYDFARVVSALFPFKPTLSAMNAALYGKGDIVPALLHLAALALAFGAAARLALTRFA